VEEKDGGGKVGRGGKMEEECQIKRKEGFKKQDRM
jgi:hypothetical protein